MQNNETQPGVSINAETWERFRRDVKARRGSIRGHLSHEVENALKEYMNASKGGDTFDRLRRIESRLDEIADAVDESESSGRTDSVSKTTEKRISEIMNDIQRRAEELNSNRVREGDVEAAIENNAGTSYKTIQRYKNLLQNQREIYQHPENQDIWFTDPKPFIACVENALPSEQANDIAEQFGWDWWEEHAPDGLLDNDGRAFQ